MSGDWSAEVNNVLTPKKPSILTVGKYFRQEDQF